MNLHIGGFVPLTLSDFPGTVAAIVFLRGCTMRCPYCHNHPLCGPGPDLGVATVLARLAERRSRLGGVVVSGGEPTLHPGLPEFLAALKALGLRVKLATNGSRPGALASLVQAGLVDHVALDLKSTWADYHRLTGVDGTTVAESLGVLRTGTVAYEVRTTVCGGWHDDQLLTELAGQIRPGERWYLQPFRPSNGVPDQGANLHPPDSELLGRIRDQARRAGIDCHTR